ncbi:hypothetical protein B0A52_02547 [Exophiala mesophila]|uniref:Uncharacterized protein n=1 Tax=Exophiala mesophila TaxID=212818 RepID=A0A438ND00_EXOME|nr:hypothetical protein B0A52_02547 [Exophiala mesophila]
MFGKRPDRKPPTPPKYKNPIGDTSKLPKARPPPKGKSRGGSSAHYDDDDDDYDDDYGYDDEEYDSGGEGSSRKDSPADRRRRAQEKLDRMKQAAKDQMHASNSTESWRKRLPNLYPAPGDSEETLRMKERARSGYVSRSSEKSEALKRQRGTRDNAQASSSRRQNFIEERDFAYDSDHPLHADSRRVKDRAKGKGKEPQRRR